MDSDATLGQNEIRYVVRLLSGRVFRSDWSTLTDIEYDRAREELSKALRDRVYGVYEITPPNRDSTVFIPVHNIETVTLELGDDVLSSER